MATNLTPEQLAQLQRLFSTPVEMGDSNAYMPENVYFNGRNYDKQDSGYLGYDLSPTDFSKAQHESLFNGQSYDQYGNDGSYTGSGKFTGIADSNKALDFIKGAAIMALPFALPAMGIGAGAAGGAGGAAGAGAAGAGAGAGGMVNGAFLGEGALSGIGAWDGALAAAGGAGAAGAGAAGAGASGGGYGTMAPIEQMAAPSYLSEAAALKPIATGIGSNLLGIGASALGGILGSQGQKQEQSSTRDIPEWLKPYAQKVLGYGGTLLDAQMQPGAMAGYDQMKSAGQGLLSQPIAGNGTSLFPARPTLMRR
jgi:hypothetical protein